MRNCKWQNVTFINCNLRDVQFRDVELKNAHFRNIDFEKVTINDIQLNDVEWRDQFLEHAILSTDSYEIQLSRSGTSLEFSVLPSNSIS